MWKRGGYGRDWRQRFGRATPLPSPPERKPRVWVQAVSVGELLAVEPLLTRLKEEGVCDVVLTTTTSTGYALARERMAGLALAVGLFPVDFAPFSAGAWKRLAPDLVVLMEGEVWPEHLHQARTRGVPVVLINGRLSDRSYRRYSRWPSLSRRLLGQITLIQACSDSDAARFSSLVPEVPVMVAGNLKFDVECGLPPSPEEQASLKRSLGLGEATVILGSSTWPGEEAFLLSALRRCRFHGRDVRLLLVPRHAERRAELTWLLQQQEWPWHLRSRSPGPPREVIVHLADTTGELRQLVRAADIVFIGKSLPPNQGGQTPIEAAAAARAIVFGPGMGNFRQAAAGLVAHGAAFQSDDPEALLGRICSLAEDPVSRHRCGDLARLWYAGNRGAVEHAVIAIRQKLAERATSRTSSR